MQRNDILKRKEVPNIKRYGFDVNHRFIEDINNILLLYVTFTEEQYYLREKHDTGDAKDFA